MNRIAAARLSARWSPTRARWCSSGSAAYKEILSERRPGGVGLITLNREKQLNALTPTLTKELVAAAKELDADPEIGAIVVTGSGSKAFAAGADIKTMASLSYMDMYKGQIFSELDDLGKVRKPVIAAVNGFALGGGCELAMACDFILASDTAKFGCAACPRRKHRSRRCRVARPKASPQHGRCRSDARLSRASGSRRSSWAPYRGWAARSASRARWARRVRWSSASQAAGWVQRLGLALTLTLTLP